MDIDILDPPHYTIMEILLVYYIQQSLRLDLEKDLLVLFIWQKTLDLLDKIFQQLQNLQTGLKKHSQEGVELGGVVDQLPVSNEQEVLRVLIQGLMEQIRVFEHLVGSSDRPDS